jgi:hypothetical protein
MTVSGRFAFVCGKLEVVFQSWVMIEIRRNAAGGKQGTRDRCERGKISEYVVRRDTSCDVC